VHLANDEAVHGIPGRTPIRAGDLVTIDVTAELDGYIADAAITIPMAKASGTKRRLATAATDALERALVTATAGATLRDLGRAVENETRRHGFTVLREVGGHGGGRTLIEDADGWTLRTSDGSPSAHAEHTVVITNGAPLVLTAA